MVNSKRIIRFKSKEMSKQTAVEWVIQHLSPLINLQQNQIDGIEEIAKQIEKQQIIKSVARWS